MNLVLPSRKISVSLMIVGSMLFASALYVFLLKKPMVISEQVSTRLVQAENQLQGSGSSDQLSRELYRDESELNLLKNKLYFQSEGRQSSEIVPYVVSILDRISDKYNIRLQGVTPLDVEKVLMLEELPFDITISGSYPDIYQWLAEAEQALNPMAVKNFSINPTRQSFGVTMKMRVVSYRLPLESG